MFFPVSVKTSGHSHNFTLFTALDYILASFGLTQYYFSYTKSEAKRVKLALIMFSTFKICYKNVYTVADTVS